MVCQVLFSLKINNKIKKIRISATTLLGTLRTTLRFFFFSEKIRLDIVCESSAYFSEKKKSQKKKRMLSAIILLGALGVNGRLTKIMEFQLIFFFIILKCLCS